MSTLMEDAADLRRRELEVRVAKAMADDMGHGDSARCMAYARAAVRVMGESRPAPAVQVPERILEIGRRMIADAKDNDHHTADPIFCVEKRRIVPGIDTDYTDSIAWIDEDGNILDDDEAAPLEAAYDETGKVPDGYTRTGYVEEWEHVDTYLTPQAAEARINGGKDGRINVNSAHRNSELRAVREFLMSLAAAPAATVATEAVAQDDHSEQSLDMVAQGGGVDVEKVMALVERYADERHAEFSEVPPFSSEAMIAADIICNEIRDLLASTAVPAGTAGDGWIAEVERLPDEDMLVLCYWEDSGKMDVCYQHNTFWQCFPPTMPEPDYWCALPPAPAATKEQEHE